MLTLLLATALADDTALWFGGGGGYAAGWDPDAGFDSQVQAEFDFRLEHKWVMVRLDLDLQVDPVNGEIDWTPPEWAMLQLGPERFQVRLGVLSPNIGLEDWDRWNNYFATFSTMFNFASPGRTVGAELNWVIGDGFNVSVFGGADWDFDHPTLTPQVGVSFWTERDSWSSWSGFTAYPTAAFYELYWSFEWYPHEWVYLNLDGGTGLSEGAPFVGSQAVVQIAPEFPVGANLRGEFLVDPGYNALGGAEEGIPDATASLALRANPTEWSQILLEGKSSWYGDQVVPGIYASVDLFVPAPSYYTARFDEEEEVAPEEEPAPGGAPVE